VAVEALTYGWEHWERLQKMDNPVGYLYRVGRNLSRRQRLPGPMFLEVPDQRMPDIEPALPQALAYLSERQRTAVVLVHCYQWTLSEVAELMGISKTTVQNHLERGMASLRRQIGDVE
jgi:DNA-directed RNA polymerase specialized sigma24 family protein